jgi:ketosteroid isomerase-like protein
MSEENLELTRLGYEAFNRGDIDGFLDICDLDIEWQDIAAIDTAAVKGRKAVRAFFETEPWEQIRRDPEEIIELGGEHVLVLSHTTGLGKGSGIVVDARAADLCTFRAGDLCVGSPTRTRHKPAKQPGCRSSALDEKRCRVIRLT